MVRRLAPARKDKALFLDDRAPEALSRIDRRLAERADFSAENALRAEGSAESTDLVLGRGRLVTFLPRAAIFLGVWGSVGLRFTVGSMAPVCSRYAAFLP